LDTGRVRTLKLGLQSLDPFGGGRQRSREYKENSGARCISWISRKGLCAACLLDLGGNDVNPTNAGRSDWPNKTLLVELDEHH